MIKRMLSLLVIICCILQNEYAQNVGIGTVTPNEKLSVDSGSIRVGKLVWDPSRNTNFVKFGDGNFVTVGEDESDDRMILRAKEFAFFPSGSYTGYVGIGTNTPASPLEISGASDLVTNNPGLRLTFRSFNGPNVSWNIYPSYNGIFQQFLYFSYSGTNVAKIDGPSGTYTAISDSNYKKDIHYYGNDPVLPKLLQLMPATYLMKTESALAKHHIGFIAQQVEKIFPEVISEDKGVKMMNYDGLIPVTIQGIKEQQEQIMILQKKNEELVVIVNDLQKELLEIQHKINSMIITKQESSPPISIKKQI